MPPKRPSLQEDPPSASSSEDEKEVENSEEEEEDEEEEGSEAEESEEEEESVKPTQPSLKSNPIPKPQSSDDEEDEEKTDLAADEEEEGEESETGSDSDSDSDNEPVKHMIAMRNVSDSKVISSDIKPISSKPMAEVPKSKKILPIPTPVPPKGSSANKEEKKDNRRKKKNVSDLEAEEDDHNHTLPTSVLPKVSASAKRRLEDTNKVEKMDKRRKKKNVSELEVEEDNHTEETDDNKAADDGKKKLFQKLWYEDDEIDLLNGLRDFKEKGHSVSDMTAFSEFVKDSLKGDFNRTQIQGKVKRMHKTFNRVASRAKNGKDPVISVPHDLKKYNIAKEIWGDHISKDNGVEANNVGIDLSVADGKKRKNMVSSNGAASPKRKVSQLPVNSPKVEQKMEAEDNGTGFEYLYLNQSLQYPNYPTLPVPPQGLTNCIAKKGWDLMGSSNAELFDHKWKAVLIAETKAYLERLDVVRDQTKLMLDALEPSDV